MSTSLTPVQTTADYLNLITSQHRNQPNFTAVITTLVAPLVALQEFLAALPNAFNLDTAIGVQLDATGQWIGYTRDVQIPITGVYFALDTANLGFDQGVWQGPYSPTTGVAQLDDATYRAYLYTCVQANQWDGSTAGVQAALATLQADITAISPSSNFELYVDNRGDMNVVMGLSGAYPSALFKALWSEGLIPLASAGVTTTWLTTSVYGAPIFGMDVQNSYISGFDTGAWGE